MDGQAEWHLCPSWQLVPQSGAYSLDCSRPLHKHVAICVTCLVSGISVWVTMKHTVPALTFYFLGWLTSHQPVKYIQSEIRIIWGQEWSPERQAPWSQYSPLGLSLTWYKHAFIFVHKSKGEEFWHPKPIGTKVTNEAMCWQPTWIFAIIWMQLNGT